MGVSRREDWSGWPCPGDLPDPGIEPTSLSPLALAGEFFTTSVPILPLSKLHPVSLTEILSSSVPSALLQNYQHRALSQVQRANSLGALSLTFWNDPSTSCFSDSWAGRSVVNNCRTPQRPSTLGTQNFSNFTAEGSRQIVFHRFPRRNRTCQPLFHISFYMLK